MRSYILQHIDCNGRSYVDGYLRVINDYYRACGQITYTTANCTCKKYEVGRYIAVYAIRANNNNADLIPKV
jgi:hypothetical protein